LPRMISAPLSRTSSGRIALTVAAVPTGMNAGVRISPRCIVMAPVRAAPSLAAMSNAKRLMRGGLARRGAEATEEPKLFVSHLLKDDVTMFMHAMLIAVRSERPELVKDRSAMATLAEHIEPARKGARKRVLMRGTLFTPDGAYVVWIRDISNTGALVTCKDRLPVECDVIFKRGPIRAPA
jgi:hypothetical protein